MSYLAPTKALDNSKQLHKYMFYANYSTERKGKSNARKQNDIRRIRLHRK